MEDYCKKHCISAYAFLNDNSVFHTAQILANNERNEKSQTSNGSTSNVKFTVPQQQVNSSSSSNQSYVKIRSSTERGYRSAEKKLLLSDFLANSNQVINNMATFNTVASNYLQTPISSGFLPFPSSTSSSFGSSGGGGGASHHQLSGLSSSFGSSLSLASSNSNQSKNYALFLIFKNRLPY